jgi:hypothetical protein
MANSPATGKIVYLFSLMAMVFVVLCVFSIQQLRKSNQVRVSDENIEDMHNTSMEIFIADVDFFGYELNNEDFYKTGNSIYLKEHDSLTHQIDLQYKALASFGDVPKNVGVILAQYDSTFKEIVHQIRLRGYKDYGMEGTMRTYAHELENKQLIPEVDLLMLRRHEKDYLLRAEMVYVNDFDALIGKLKSRYKGVAADRLDQYSKSFHEFVLLSDMIGLETQTHLKGKLNELTKQFIASIEDMDHTADKETAQAYRQGLTFFAIAVIGGTILCLALIIIIASKLKPQ